MPFDVTTGTQLQCTMGTTPCAINATPGAVTATTPAATVLDFKPTANIPTFGMCMSLGNPQVAAATSAAQGVLTPQPCIPATTTPWAPGSVTSAINAVPALTNAAVCQCNWGGTVSIIAPSQQFAQGT